MDKNARSKAIEISETTMLGDLMKCVVEQIKVMQKPWDALPEKDQQEFLDRIELQMREASEKAINIIACDNMPSLLAAVDQVVFKDGVKCTLKLAKSDPNVFDLAAHEGGMVRLIIPSDDTLITNEGKPEAEPDQRGMELGHEYAEQD